jgi:hypothetical protein
MRARLYLRSAAVLTLLLGVGHLLGRPWVPANDLGAKVVVVAMKSHSMQVMGFDRTMMDFYGGFGLIVGVNLLAEAVLLWLVAELVSSDATRARRIAAVFLVMNAAVTALAAAYLFTAPLVLSAAVTLCLGAAVLAPARQTAS